MDIKINNYLIVQKTSAAVSQIVPKHVYTYIVGHEFANRLYIVDAVKEVIIRDRLERSEET